MDIMGMAKSHHAKSTAAGKASSKLSDSLWEKITGCGAGHLYGEYVPRLAEKRGRQRRAGQGGAYGEGQ